MSAKNLITALAALTLTLFASSCGSARAAAPAAVSAPAPAPAAASLNCSSPVVFRGADDGVQNALAIFTLCQPVNMPSTGGSYQADVTYTLQHAFMASQIVTWLGTAQGSIEETAGEITLEVPTSVAGQFRTMAIITNQKDKHADVEGERIEHFSNGVYNLPSGSRIHIFTNLGIINPSANCPSNGCGMQLNVYLNGVAQ